MITQSETTAEHAALLERIAQGNRLTRAERHRAAELTLELMSSASDRQIARALAVSREFVANIRRTMTAAGAIPGDMARVGSDGKTYREAGKRSRPERPPLALLTTQIQRLTGWLENGAGTDYTDAATADRGLFHAAVIHLAARAERLRRGK